MTHEHLHLFADGLRRLVHDHEHPESQDARNGLRVHRHVNGEHTHPHGHAHYEPLPPGEERRPIVART